MFCKSCGKQIPDGSTFCPVCGTATGFNCSAANGAANASASATSRGSESIFARKGTYATGLARSPFSIVTAIYLALMLIFMFQPWVGYDGNFIGNAFDSLVDGLQSQTSSYTNTIQLNSDGTSVSLEEIISGLDNVLDDVESAIDDAVPSLLTLPSLFGNASLRSLMQTPDSILSQSLGTSSDEAGSNDVLQTVVLWISFTLWMLAVAFLTFAFIANLRGAPLGDRLAKPAFALAASDSILWIVVIFVANSKVVEQLKDSGISGISSSVHIPSLLFFPSAWTWVVAVMSVLGFIGLVFYSSYRRTDGMPFSGVSSQYPAATYQA